MPSIPHISDDIAGPAETGSNRRGSRRREVAVASLLVGVASPSPSTPGPTGPRRPRSSQSCLLARRLAEAGVPMVSVHYCRRPPGWDTHGGHFEAMKGSLGPTLDRAFAALVTDLDRRGLLGSTLVWVNSVFGRTPLVNAAAGRDHWPWAYSLVMAGGGVAGGVCVGASEAIAEYPTRDPHDPSDRSDRVPPARAPPRRSSTTVSAGPSPWSTAARSTPCSPEPRRTIGNRRRVGLSDRGRDGGRLSLSDHQGGSTSVVR